MAVIDSNTVRIYSKRLFDYMPAQLIGGKRYRSSAGSGTFALRLGQKGAIG
ncbi:hypothetical protein N5J70_20235 [Pseudomonas sp. GD03909]|nr:hypothetical protein [Pseudomonas sp. GD03909]